MSETKSALGQAGFSMIEVMAALGLSAIVAMGMAMMIQYQAQANRTQMMMANASSLSTYFQGQAQAVFTQANISKVANNSVSVYGNQMLNCCILGDCSGAQLTGDNLCHAGTNVPFVLFDTATPPNAIAGINTSLSGYQTSYSKAPNTYYYETNGSTLCTPMASDPTCMLQAVAKYTLTCTGGSATCSPGPAGLANGLTITVSVQSAMLTTGGPINTPGGIPVNPKQATVTVPLPISGSGYSISCAYASGNWYCLKMNGADGSTGCSENTSNPPTVGGWTATCSSMPAIAAGKYSINCYTGASNKLICARTDMTSGITYCNVYSSGNWSTSCGTF